MHVCNFYGEGIIRRVLYIFVPYSQSQSGIVYLLVIGDKHDQLLITAYYREVVHLVICVCES